MLASIDECIYEINDILSLLCKGEKDKWVGLANRMTKLLTQAWSEEQKEAIREAIRFFAAGETETITKKEFDFVIQSLQDKLGARLAEVFRKDVQKIQLESYTKGHTDVGIEFEFNTTDKLALSWLFEKDVKQFWIGDSYSADLNDSLNKIAGEVIKEGLGRDDAAKLFGEKLGDEFEKTNNYWDLLSNHIVTRAREFGRTSAYEKAGIEYIKIVAVIDQRTSAICRFLNGKIIKVSKLVEQRNKLLKVETVEQVKKIAPWYSDKEVEYFGDKFSKIYEAPPGTGSPPYHARCRTTTSIAYAEEIIQIDEILGEKFVPAKTIKEAAEFALKNNFADIVNYSKAKLDTANELNRILFDNKKFGIKFDEIIFRKTPPQRNFRPVAHIISFEGKRVNKRSLMVNQAHIDWADKIKGGFNNYVKRAYDEGWWVCENFEDIINHELGHRLTIGEIDTKNGVDDFLLTMRFVHKNISAYGRSSGEEALAEIWALFRKSGKEALKDDWVEFFNKYSQRVKI